MRFANRSEAGARLAERLPAGWASPPLVLALSRGGAPVAFEVARQLGAPFDLWLTRSLAEPGSPEVALGAVAEGGGLYLDPERAAADSETEVMLAASRAAGELEALALRLRAGRQPPGLAGRDLLLVDDLVQSGARLLAALEAVGARGARRVLAAAPVVAAPALARVEARAGALVWLQRAREGPTPAAWFADAAPVSDDQLQELLAWGAAPGGAWR